MTDELIVQQLKNRETQLLNELNKVRLALQAFIDDIGFGSSETYNGYAEGNIPAQFDKNLTYGSKILFILAQSDKPMLVDEITDQLHAFEPELEMGRLHKSVSHNVSMLAKYAKVRKHPFNRKIKYSL
ncbi:MAG TPA: hypothetical protein VFE53_27055 [Mucilaginibacter sp.]|jgi:hypothetical protein|nr:hypothetical protein [Mucilaginibacter sp.]